MASIWFHYTTLFSIILTLLLLWFSSLSVQWMTINTVISIFDEESSTRLRLQVKPAGVAVQLLVLTAHGLFNSHKEKRNTPIRALPQTHVTLSHRLEMWIYRTARLLCEHTRRKTTAFVALLLFWKRLVSTVMSPQRSWAWISAGFDWATPALSLSVPLSLLSLTSLHLEEEEEEEEE